MGGSLFRAVHCYSFFFLISLSFLPLNHLCSFPSIGDLVCVGSTTQTSPNEVNLQNHVHLPDTFFSFTSCILLSNGLTFPSETSYQKPSQAKPMICFLSPFAFSLFFFWLFQGQFSSACFVTPSVFLYHLRFCYCFALPYPGSLRMSEVPISTFPFFFFFFFSLSYPTFLVWSGLAWLVAWWFSLKHSIAIKHFKSTHFLFSYNVGCFIV